MNDKSRPAARGSMQRFAVPVLCLCLLGVVSAALLNSKSDEQKARAAEEKSNLDEQKRTELARQGLRDAAATMDAQFKAVKPFKVGK